MILLRNAHFVIIHIRIQVNEGLQLLHPVRLSMKEASPLTTLQNSLRIAENRLLSIEIFFLCCKTHSVGQLLNIRFGI